MDALEVLWRVLFDTLKNASPLWAERVYPDRAPAEIVRPYVTWNYVAGGEINMVRRGDAEFVVTVKCVADTMADAMLGARLIGQLLNDKGQQDATPAPISAVGWILQTITQEKRIHLVEAWEGAVPIYHGGHDYRIRLEEEI